MTLPAPPRWSALRDSLTERPADSVLSLMANEIRKASTFLLTAHLNPDGDAVGSAVALSLGLRALGKSTRVLFDTPVASKLVPVLPPDSFEVLNEDAVGRLRGPFDLCILLDTSEPARAGGLSRLLLAPGQRTLCVDHHMARGPSPFSEHLVLPESPSTGNLVLALLRKLEVPLDRPISQALWLAVASDTGWFRFENTSPWVLEDAALLAQAGLPVPALYRQIYEEMSIGRARVLGRVLSGIRSELGGAFALSVVTAAELEAQGLALADLDGMVDHLKAVSGVSAVALIVETAPGSYKISLRAVGDLEVESLARQLGGGGHARAAGCRFTGTFEELLSFLRRGIQDRLPGGTGPVSGGTL